MSLASLFNKTCTIRRYEQTQNATTGQPEESWSNLAENVPCCLNTLKGDERFISGMKKIEATHKIYLYPDQDITKKDEVLFEGTSFDVVVVGDGANRDHHLEVMLKIIE